MRNWESKRIVICFYTIRQSLRVWSYSSERMEPLLLVWKIHLGVFLLPWKWDLFVCFKNGLLSTKIQATSLVLSRIWPEVLCVSVLIHGNSLILWPVLLTIWLTLDEWIHSNFPSLEVFTVKCTYCLSKRYLWSKVEGPLVAWVSSLHFWILLRLVQVLFNLIL